MISSIVAATMFVATACGPNGCSNGGVHFFGHRFGNGQRTNFVAPYEPEIEPGFGPETGYAPVPAVGPVNGWAALSPGYQPLPVAQGPVANLGVQQGFQTINGHTYYLQGTQWYCLGEDGDWLKYVQRWEPIERDEESRGRKVGRKTVRANKEDTCCHGLCGDECDCEHCHHERCKKQTAERQESESGVKSPKMACCDGNCADCQCGDDCPYPCNPKVRMKGKRAKEKEEEQEPLRMIGANSDHKVLAFHADWCVPCKEMEPIEANVKAQGYDIEVHDVDDERALSKRYKVHTLPTYILIKDGREVKRLKGSQTEEDLIGLFRENESSQVANTPIKNYGLDLAKMGHMPKVGMYMASGGGEANRMVGAISDSSIPDESKKPWLLAIGSKEETGPIESDVKSGKIDGNAVRFRAYTPDYWHVKDMGYAPGHPRVRLGDPSKNKGLYSEDAYNGPEEINEAIGGIHKANPNYDPSKDPGSHHHGPGGSSGIKVTTLVIIGAILVAAFLFL